MPQERYSTKTYSHKTQRDTNTLEERLYIAKRHTQKREIQTHTCTYTHAHAHAHTSVCLRMLTVTHTHTHTHTRTHRSCILNTSIVFLVCLLYFFFFFFFSPFCSHFFSPSLDCPDSFSQCGRSPKPLNINSFFFFFFWLIHVLFLSLQSLVCYVGT